MHLVRSLLGGIFFVAYAIGGLVIGAVVFPPLALLRARRARRALVKASWLLFVGTARATRLFRVEIEPEDRARLAAARGCVVVANHPTLIDVVVLTTLLPDSTAVAKAAAGRNIFYSLVVRGAFLMNDDPARLVDEAVALLRSGVNLMVFPEGTRTPVDAQRREWRRGAAQFAIRAGVPLLPVSVTCDPPVLAKGQAWHDLAGRTISWRIRAYQTIEPVAFPRISARAASAELSERLRRTILDGAGNPQRNIENCVCRNVDK